MNEKPRILIVDDDEESVRLLRSAFEEGGFEVISAFDGLEGLDLATKHLPDVIVTGIIMPRMTGFEMIRNLQNNVATAKIPILVYSHLGREGDRVEAEKLGVKDFFIRGLVTPHEIIERVNRVISRGNIFYLSFDPQQEDARLLAQMFHFSPYFECPDGERMVLKIEPLESTGEQKTFKATFVCKSSE